HSSVAGGYGRRIKSAGDASNWRARERHVVGEASARRDGHRKLGGLTGNDRGADRCCTKGEIGVSDGNAHRRRRTGSEFVISGVGGRQGMGAGSQSVVPERGNTSAIQGSRSQARVSGVKNNLAGGYSLRRVNSRRQRDG